MTHTGVSHSSGTGGGTGKLERLPEVWEPGGKDRGALKRERPPPSTDSPSERGSTELPPRRKSLKLFRLGIRILLVTQSIICVHSTAGIETPRYIITLVLF